MIDKIIDQQEQMVPEINTAVPTVIKNIIDHHSSVIPHQMSCLSDAVTRDHNNESKDRDFLTHDFVFMDLAGNLLLVILLL